MLYKSIRSHRMEKCQATRKTSIILSCPRERTSSLSIIIAKLPLESLRWGGGWARLGWIAEITFWVGCLMLLKEIFDFGE